MKRFLVIFVLLFAVSASFAQMSPEQSARINAAARIASRGHLLLTLVKRGDVDQFKKELAYAPHRALLQIDAHGNNILHLASSEDMFKEVWKLFDEAEREDLLAQRNKAGETPMMVHIMYGHEAIFLQYFPQTSLYAKLRKTTFDLQSNGLNRDVAEIKKEDLIERCSIGRQTMWQRARALYHEAYTQDSHAKHRDSMRAVQNMIADAAPFLVVRG